jgi:hypothetical protein
MTNLIFVQGCTPSALGLGVYMVVVTVVFSVFCLIGGAFAMAAAVGAKNDPMAPPLLTLFYIVMSLLSWLLTAFLIFTLFHPIGFSPTTTKGGPRRRRQPLYRARPFQPHSYRDNTSGAKDDNPQWGRAPRWLYFEPHRGWVIAFRGCAICGTDS